MPHLITDDGVRLNYIESGSGPLLVICLHFMGGCAGNYCDLAFRLDRSRCRFVALDFRGHGDSESRPSEFTADRLARDVLNLADALGAFRFAIIGHSFGGKVALKIAALVPDRVVGVVLLGAVGPGQVSFEREVVEGILNRSQELDFLLECFRGWFRPGREAALAEWLQQFQRTPVWALQAVCELALWTDLTKEIGVVELPSLVVTGSHDPVYGFDYQRAAVLPALAQPELVSCDCGHGMMVENNAAIADVCERFIARLSGEVQARCQVKLSGNSDRQVEPDYVV